MNRPKICLSPKPPQKATGQCYVAIDNQPIQPGTPFQARVWAWAKSLPPLTAVAVKITSGGIVGSPEENLLNNLEGNVDCIAALTQGTYDVTAVFVFADSSICVGVTTLALFF